MTVVGPSSIPFGWKVIPQTAEAASVTLRVNLERLNIHFAPDGFIMNVELGGKWKSQHVCVPLSHTHTTNNSEHLEVVEQILQVVF